MQKKKQHKPIKKTIIFTILTILLLLLIFAEDIIKLTNRNKTALLENTPNETTIVEPNIPVLSAGMIPVKWENDHFVITTKDDPNWYDYRNSKPAYIMLNDGYYQSELIRDMTNKELAENSVGKDALVVPDVPDNNPTILMWIPRFAINDNTNEIQYIKNVETANENWTIPEMFTYKQEDETKPDFLLTGIWVEKDVDNAYTTKINQMNQEESIYGFIKNTVAISSDQSSQNTIQTYIQNLVEADDSVRPQITDITNSNRIILHIINPKNQDWVKAKAYYDKETGVIKIEVTYTKNGIEKIQDEDGNTLSENSKTADTGDKILEKTEYTFTVIDKAGNKKKLKVTGIIPEFYGKEVTNYDCSVEGIKWRIFHKDDENIYLIADDYIPYTTIPKSTNGTALNKGNTDYMAYFTSILKDYTGSEWILNNTNKNAQKWFKYLDAYQNSTNTNMPAVAYMMDTNSWSSFAGSNAEYAIGGPTIELFCESYKVTHPDRYIECNSITDDGYMVKWSSDSDYSNSVSGLAKDEYKDVYIKDTRDKATGMWIASPSDRGMNFLAIARYLFDISHASYGNYFGQDNGFRPIVCIKSGIGLQNNGDGTYRLDIPIEARAYYDETAEKMKIEVTYTKNGISKILDQNGNTLSENSLTAETAILRNGTYKYTVVDKLGNTKEVTAKVEGLKTYVIQNLEELKEFRDEVNAGNNFSGIKVIQTADISMNEGKYTINEENGEITFAEDAEQWEPIGNNVTTNNRFYGDYDGQGHTISGIYINSENQYQGLFGLASTGTIKNLGIEKSKITSTRNYIGGIAGSLENAENCYNSAEVNGSDIVGGITGGGSSSSGIITNCYNTGKISSNGIIGGICGNNSANISNCYNTGKITSTSSGVGGICGYTNNGYVEIKNCYNIGEVYAKSGSVAGIIGDTSNLKSIIDCYNAGNISSEGNEVAGIVGDASQYLRTIDKCYNLGNIDGRNSCAGIVGSGSNPETTNCYNIGNIKGNEYIGGIIGFSTYKIQKNYNVGIIEGTRYVGGVLGYKYGSNGVVTNNYFETGTSNYGVGYPQENSGCTFGTKDEIIPLIVALDEYKADESNINNGYPLLSWQTDNDKLNLINGDNAFVEDTNNINNGYPILAWQVKCTLGT